MQKSQVDGKPCETVNYLDPYCFWNWKGTINCAHCGTVYAIHMIQGHMYKGPDEQPAGTKPDTSPLYADKPLEGYINFPSGMEGRTRPFQCLPRHIYLGVPDMVKFSIRGKPLQRLAAPAEVRGHRRTVSLQLGSGKAVSGGLGRVSGKDRQGRSQGMVTGTR